MNKRVRVGKDRAERRRLKVARRLKQGYVGQPPDFILVGAQKSGTTSLYSYLAQHPDVGKSLRKEIHFFSWHYEERFDWYLAHFPKPDEFTVAGEASTSYLSDPDVPERVRLAVPNVKLIAVLRDPVDRAFSQYQMNIRKGLEPLAFENAIAAEPERLRTAASRSTTQWRYSSYLTRGRYAEQLERWLTVFPRHQLLVLKSEAVFARPVEALRQTLDFLGLPSWNLEQYDQRNAGTYEGMRPETRERLREYFAPHNQRLYEMLDWNLGWDDE